MIVDVRAESVSLQDDGAVVVYGDDSMVVAGPPGSATCRPLRPVAPPDRTELQHGEVPPARVAYVAGPFRLLDGGFVCRDGRGRVTALREAEVEPGLD